MEEGPVPQKPEFNVKEAEWAPLPESDDEAEQWPSGTDWAPLPDDEAGISVSSRGLTAFDAALNAVV
ncbi:unnamed protein product [Brugia timori]|nr:unnamed protein product [Brugia timori]